LFPKLIANPEIRQKDYHKPRKLAARNWQMNGLRANLIELAKLEEIHADASLDILIFLPATLITQCEDTLFNIGGQDCHAATGGAHNSLTT
jgi:triosephosphate isomerase